MKVNSNNRDISFKGFYNNKTLQKTLEFAADYGALFGATTTLACSTFIRPATIMAVPHTEKENKTMACAKSISSGLTQFALTYLVSKPLAKPIEKIAKDPDKYLNYKTLKFFKEGKNNIKESKSFEFVTQLFKLGVSALVIIPKAKITTNGMPVILEKILHKQQNKDGEKTNITPNFKGSRDKSSKVIGKILNKKSVQKFSDKYKDSNFVMHVVALIDTLATGAFINETLKSKKIEEKRKKALIYNAGISTTLSIITSYVLDKLTKPATNKFILKYKQANKNSPNLEKQLRGINIAKPFLIMASVYYILIPFVSTLLAEFADKNPHLDLPSKSLNKI